jgi:alkylation response protein AidB-like acyl-CoA dehydrogenase
MDFNHTDDRRMLSDTLQRFVADHASPFIRAEAANSAPGYDPALWARYAELGAIGALFPPEQGGYGGAGFDIMVVFDAVGRGLVAEPFLTALMAGRALARAGGRNAEIERIISGADVVAFALQEADARYDGNHVTTRAKLSGNEWIIDGAKTVIHDVEGASSLLLSARTSSSPTDCEGVSLFLVPIDAVGLSINGYPCVDGGRAAEIRLHQVRVSSAALVGAANAAGSPISGAVDAGLLALCAEAFGAMEVVRDATLEFLRTRVQFGAPIGRNQALQHRMASLLIEIEQARSAVINAAASLDGPRDLRDRALSAAKYTIGKTGTLVAEEAIQLHGGIGMTWELGMAHYAKRLMMINHQLGDDDYHLARYAALGRAA